MPDHNFEPWGPLDSGRNDMSRKKNGRRFSLAAVLNRDRTSSGFQPKGIKKSGPSGGPNLKGAPAWLKCEPIFFCSIFKSPGDIISRTQRWKLGGAARSLASAPT